MTRARLIPAKTTDLAELLELLKEYYAYDGLSLDRAQARVALRRLLVDPSIGRVWLMQAGQNRAGYVIVCFGYSIEFGGRYAFIDELFVREPFRGSGLGTQVMDRLERFCARSGAKVMRLEVERSNRGAQRFYKRRRFKAHDRNLMTQWL